MRRLARRPPIRLLSQIRSSSPWASLTSSSRSIDDFAVAWIPEPGSPYQRHSLLWVPGPEHQCSCILRNRADPHFRDSRMKRRRFFCVRKYAEETRMWKTSDIRHMELPRGGGERLLL